MKIGTEYINLYLMYCMTNVNQYMLSFDEVQFLHSHLKLEIIIFTQSGVEICMPQENSVNTMAADEQGAVSIRKTVLPGMAIPMLKIRRPNGRLIFNMEIAIRR